MSTSCKHCDQLQKKINILTSDYEFQIKKIKEDKSTEKALYEIHLQKQIRKYQQLYQQEKAAREQENQQWILKYDSSIRKHESELSELKLNSQNLLKETVDSLVKEHTGKYDEMVSKYEKRHKATVDGYESGQKQTKQKHQKQINILVNNHSQVIDNIKRTHSNMLDLKCKQYEGMIVGKESELTTEQNLHKKTKIEAKELQSKLYEQIFAKKKTIIELQGDIKSLKETIIEKKKEISRRGKTIEELEEKNIQEKDQLQKLHEEVIAKIDHEAKGKIRKIYEDTLKSCNQYKDALINIESTRQNEKELYLNNIEQIELTIENRASKVEDLQQIQQLKMSLSKKTKECETLYEELKYYRLELENKEQTYNRIFVPIAGVNGENNNFVSKRKEFKLRRAGKSVTTVREILQSVNSGNNLVEKKGIAQKSKIL